MKIIFLGGQGSGKSTQAKMLAEKLKRAYTDMGQTLRDRARVNDDLGKQIKKTLDQGHLVENKVTIKLLKEQLIKKEYRKGYILDGYPRNSVQLEALDKDIDKVFYIKVADNVAIKRLTLRGRCDDTKEALEKRLEIYHRETEPLLSKFGKLGILEEVDGERSIEEIHKDVLARVTIKS